MNSFTKGVLVGIGIGLLIAPMKGEETRKLLRERLIEMRGYLPENEQLDAYRQQVSHRVSQTASNLKDYAQQTASTLKDTAENLRGIAQNAGSDVKEAGEEIADTTRQAVRTSSSKNTP